MKKSILLLTLVSSLSAVTVFAGGTMGGNPGNIAKMKPLLEANWNGKSGIQHSLSYGIVVQWNADVCGTLNGHILNAADCIHKTAKAKQ